MTQLGYIYSNVLFLMLIIIIFLICLSMDNWTFKKIKVKQMSYISVICSVSVLLTNCISYSFSLSYIHFSLALGQWLLFSCGLVFGPLCGFICAICTEIVGDIINVGGVFHLGFLFSSVLCAFFGSIVFKFANKKRYFWIGISYTIYYIFKAFLINPVCYYYIGFYNGVFINLIITLIRTPFLIFLYLSLIYATYPVFIKIIYNKPNLPPTKKDKQTKEIL